MGYLMDLLTTALKAIINQLILSFSKPFAVKSPERKPPQSTLTKAGVAILKGNATSRFER